MIKKLILTLIFALVPVISGAATYYVAEDGSDGNAGTTGSRWATIQKCADTLVAGDNCIVGNGTYTDPSDNEVVDVLTGGSEGSPITYKSENKWGAVIDGGSPDPYKYCFFSDNSNESYITIEDFEMLNCTVAIHLNDQQINWTIKGNWIHNIGRTIGQGGSAGQNGIFIGIGTDSIIIDSNLFHTIGQLNPLTTPPVDFEDCDVGEDSDPCFGHDHAIYWRGDNGTIINNIFYDLVSGYAVQISPETTNLDMVNNTFDNYNPGRSSGGQIILWGGGRAEFSFINIENNIFNNPYLAAIDCLSTHNGHDIVIQDNITTTASMFGSRCSGANLDSIVDSENIDTNNTVSTDPLFVDLDNNDYHLTSESPAIDAAIDGNVPDHDFDDVTRNLVYDMGAYTFVSEATGTTEFSNNLVTEWSDNKGTGFVDVGGPVNQMIPAISTDQGEIGELMGF